MENSAYEALITGVNATIFIVATTIAIMLFTTVLDLSDLANNDVINKPAGSVMVGGAQTVNDKNIETRIITGTELLGYYTNYTKNILKVIDGSTKSLSEYIEAGYITQEFANKNFKLYLESVDHTTGEETYVFEKISQGALPTSGFIVLPPPIITTTPTPPAVVAYAYNNPIVPSGFTKLETSEASWSNISTNWNNGLVIIDANFNEFVWVPVKDGVGTNGAYISGDNTTVQYKKWCTSGFSYINTTDDTWPIINSEDDQITKYGGFYIARYESAFDFNGGNLRAASKVSMDKTLTSWSTTRNNTYNGYLWNYINYAAAKKYAEEMASKYGYDTSKVETNLVTGKQWDTAMRWISNSAISVTDSRTWGNYYNSTSPANVTGYGNLQRSGYSNNWKAKNIYDLSGNVWEWTMEAYDTSYRVVRGGSFGSVGGGAGDPASDRSYFGPGSSGYGVGFRPALYIK